jgi:hypothetical protein
MAMCVMAVVGVAPCHIARSDFYFWFALALHPPAAGCHNQGLSERMNMPSGASAGLERDANAEDASRFDRLKQGVNTYSSCKILFWAFAGRLRAAFFDFHFLNSSNLFNDNSHSQTQCYDKLGSLVFPSPW